MDGESVKGRERTQCEAVAQKRLHFVNQLNFQLCAWKSQQEQSQATVRERVGGEGEEGSIKVNAGTNKGNDTIIQDQQQWKDNDTGHGTHSQVPQQQQQQQRNRF